MAHARQFVTLGVNGEIFAIPIESVQEILDLREFARLPNAPAFLLGMIDLRGRGVPVLDLRGKLGLRRVEPTSTTRIIVLDLVIDGRNLALGLVADCVFEVTELSGETLEETPPAFGARPWSDCIEGIGRKGERFVFVLDLGVILSREASALAEAIAA